jgi:hypothetical protein
MALVPKRWVEGYRIGRENESREVIPQQKEEFVRGKPVWRPPAAAGGPCAARRPAEKTLISS